MPIIFLLNCHKKQLSASLPHDSIAAGLALPGRTDAPARPSASAPARSLLAGVKPTLFQHQLKTKNIFPQHTIISRQFRMKQLNSTAQDRVDLITLLTSVFLLVVKSTEQVYIRQQQKQHVLRETLHMPAKAVCGLCTLWPLFESFWRETRIKQAQEWPTVPNQLLISVCRKVMNCF